MPKYEKVIGKMKRAPNTIRPDEIEYVLEQNAFVPKRQQESHRTYVNLQTGEAFTIPIRNPIKKYYVEALLKRVGENNDTE